MDVLFNKMVPPSKDNIHVIRPYGKTFINGLASSFEIDSYNKELLGHYITKTEYESMIENLNDILYNNWPCTPCQLIGYLLCPCTLGLSFLCPGFSVI